MPQFLGDEQKLTIIVAKEWAKDIKDISIMQPSNTMECQLSSGCLCLDTWRFAKVVE